MKTQKGLRIAAGVLGLLLLLAYPVICLEGHVPGEVIVRFSDHAVRLPSGPLFTLVGDRIYAPSGLMDSLRAVGINQVSPLRSGWDAASPGSGILDFSNIYLLSCSEMADIPYLVQRLKSFPGILDAQPNYQYDLYWTPDDDLYWRQWHLENIGQLDALPDIDMDLEAAWDTVLGTGIPIYTLDTGVETGHEDITGATNVENCTGAQEYDTYGHGTAVAGVIAADCNNSKGIAGINCSNASNIRAIKIAPGGGQGPTSTTVKCGFDYAADQGARVLNCSFGFCASPLDEDFLVTAAARNAYLSGTYGGLLVCANAYHSLCPKYNEYGVPAAYSFALGVNAIVKDGFSWHDNKCANYVDIIAPGGQCITTTTLYDGYDSTWAGTSAAAPMVSGVAALLLGVVDTLTNDDLAYIITRTATTTEPWTFDPCHGWGKINAHRAVRFISGPDRQFMQGTLSTQEVSIADSSDYYQKTFKYLKWCFEDSSLPDGPTTYLVKRYKLTGSISFGPPYLDAISNVWVRHGSGISPGWPDDNPLNCVLTVGWGSVDTTSWDSTSVTVYTYTYALYETGDTSFVGYYPIHPDNVEIPYSAVLGGFDEDPYVEVIKPNGGENWGCGMASNKKIQWNASDDDGIDSVSIYWSPGYESQWSSARCWPFELTTGEENDSEWTWAVQSEDTCSVTSRIAVVAYDGRLDGNYDISDADFKAGGPQEGQVPPMRPRGRIRPVCYTESGTTVYFNVPDPRVVRLEIYDVRGRLVRTLVDGEVLEGTHRAKWDLRNTAGARLPQGIYFYRFSAGGFRDSGKIVILK
jgi:hypothetical protein